LNSRIQLTLFATGSAAERIEEIRRLLDPVQFNLIAAHVTLCREDELEGLNTAVLRQRLSASKIGPLTLTFGAPESFSTHGILLPCAAGEENFRALRQLVLGSAAARFQVPHITLAHPRNPKSAGNSLAAASSLERVGAIRFESICLIQQYGASPWRIVERFELPAAKDSDA
jgi:2'-5' RNA ligase